MRMSKELVQGRERMVIAMLIDKPELTNEQLSRALKKKTGTGSTDKFLNVCRQAWERSKGKFADSRTKPLNGLNGNHAVQQSYDPGPAQSVGDIEQPEGKAAFEKAGKADYVPGSGKRKEYTLEEAAEKSRPALNNLSIIVGRCPDLVAYTVMRREDGSIGIFRKYTKRSEEQDEVVLE